MYHRLCIIQVHNVHEVLLLQDLAVTSVLTITMETQRKWVAAVIFVTAVTTLISHTQATVIHTQESALSASSILMVITVNVARITSILMREISSVQV